MTFSIVAGDPETGELGIATTTCLVGVGDVVPGAKVGVGVIGCQAHIRPSSRQALLDHLEAGVSIEQAIALVLKEDPQAKKRQILGLDARCKPYVYTGEAVPDVSGAIIGTHHAIAGNLLADEAVVHAVDMQFNMTSQQPLAHRLVRSLVMGEQAGGDKRGRMSAALLLVSPQNRPLSLRIDYSDDPLSDLEAALLSRLSPELIEAFNR
jgi:uncharacterized Ntn-hydrolase superfamily protein